MSGDASSDVPGAGGEEAGGISPASLSAPSEGSGSNWPPTNRYGARAVPLANDARGVVARSIEALASLPADLPPAAVVGGLAVMVRLYEAHRVTTDFDQVSAGADLTVTRLVALGAERTRNGVRLPEHQVRLDLLDANQDLVELEELTVTDELEARAVNLAMAWRYALDTAVPTRILAVEAGASGTAGPAVVARVEIPVAVAGALVAMKLLAARSPRRAELKVASDIYDAWRLIRAWGPTVVAEDLARAPLALVDATIEHLRDLFGDDVERTGRHLASASAPGVEAITIEDLEQALAVVDALAPFTRWDPST